MRKLTLVPFVLACHPSNTTVVQIVSGHDVPPIAEGCKQGGAEVTYDGDMFTATICPNVTAPSLADAVYVGATVGWPDGRRRDLAAVDVPLAARGTPVTLREKVGPGVTRARVMVWGAKLYVATAPDDAQDVGAERFGYILDQPLGVDAGDVFPDGIELDPLPKP